MTVSQKPEVIPSHDQVQLSILGTRVLSGIITTLALLDVESDRLFGQSLKEPSSCFQPF